jgi:hypothetical protein
MTTAAMTFNLGYNTLTLSMPNHKKKVCQCGVPLPPGAGIALTVADEPYQGRRAPRMCLTCALDIIRARPGFRLLKKDYLHLMETNEDGPLSPDEAARLFAEAYQARQTESTEVTP